MEFTLRDYQQQVSDGVLAEYDKARRVVEVAPDMRMAIGLSAPTGAGKTVIAASVLERLYFGDADREPNPDLTVLWVTDDPELNEQSREKILVASKPLRGMLYTIDAGFDRSELAPGMVYFLNIQKLGTATSYTKPSDARRFTLWESIANTVAARGHNLLVIIDEAHRGISDRNGRTTILRTILDGGRIDIKQVTGPAKTIFSKPVPVVLGISATSEKFETAMQGASAGRNLTKVVADGDLVRQSGLIKDFIDVAHDLGKENQPNDDTLLREGVHQLVRIDGLWQQRFLSTQGLDWVAPLMVIQVADNAGPSVVEPIVQALVESWPSGFESPDSIVHCFGDKAAVGVHLTVGGLQENRTIKYVSPQDVTKDDTVRAVIFMKALTTGWDCPRAEVMVSQRSSKDPTDIAQLIGRMVRTPLARRIEDPGYEDLNRVTLYLPHYKDEEVQAVIASFAEDEDIQPTVTLQPILLTRNPVVPASVWEAAEKLPREEKPRKRFSSDISRMVALATELDAAALITTSGDDFESECAKVLVDTMAAEHARLRTDIEQDAEDLLEITFGFSSFAIDGESAGTTTRTLATSRKNLRELLQRAKRVLREHTGKRYLEHLEDHEGYDYETAVATVAALSKQTSVPLALEAASKVRIDAWRKQHASHIAILRADRAKEITQLWHPAGLRTVDTLVLPEGLTKGAKDPATMGDLPRYSKHLFADREGLFPEKLGSSWEEEVVERELEKPSLLAWYRNPHSGRGAVSVHYVDNGTDRTLYPDLVFFHQTPSGVVADLIDPHGAFNSDTTPKWRALLRFAKEHPLAFRRVACVIKDDAGQLRAIDLVHQDENVLGPKIEAANGLSDWLALFDEYGSDY